MLLCSGVQRKRRGEWKQDDETERPEFFRSFFCGNRFYPKISHKGSVWKATDAGCSDVSRVDVQHSELTWL